MAAREVVIVAPPAVSAQSMSAAVYLLPMLSGMGSMAFVLIYPGILFKAIGAAVAVLSLGSALAMWLSQRRMFSGRRRQDHRKYLEYLADTGAKLAQLARVQAGALDALHPAPAELPGVAQARTHVWERRRGDEDFLIVPVGRGRVKLACPAHLDLGPNPLIEYEPDLLARARHLAGQYQTLERAPVLVDLRAVGTLSVSGPRGHVQNLMRALLSSLAVYQGPDDLQLAVWAPGELATDWEWVKWLPHTRRRLWAGRDEGDLTLSLLADDGEGLRGIHEEQVLPRLQQGLRPQEQRRGLAAALTRPHLVVVLDGFDPNGPAGTLPRLDDCFRHAAASGITFVCLVGDRRREPPDVQARLTLGESGLAVLEQVAFGGDRTEGVRSDSLEVTAAEALARALAPLQLDEQERSRDLSETVRLLDLLGVGDAAGLDTAALRAGAEADPLRIPIGLRSDGHPVLLDLKEAAAGGLGPHGLLVGATGSGKSELLRTLVTALALTHDPELLSFVFVDFKGGAALADLAGLPHCAGMITNIERDLTLVDRMLSALLGEQERRQRLLREAGNLDNIREYRTRRAADPALEAMPYLLVIVDEFGELLANRPDFLELFVTLGRVGRSLGIHLLLATQRLDEGRIRGLESHLRYRICLRTFSSEESSTVLGSPDAHHLPSYPGIGYFKVDSVYDLFKAATVSTPAEAATAAGPSPAVRRFTPTGRLISASGAPPARPLDGRSDMDVAIQRIAEAGLGRAHQVWLQPLPLSLPLESVVGRDLPPLAVAIGLLDMPRQQRQKALTLDFSGIGGHLAVVGASQTGKSTLLRSILSAFLLWRDPRDVQFYCVDLGGGSLHQLEGLPHVGVVCGASDRALVHQVVRHVRTVIEEREFTFRERGLDGMAAYRRLRASRQLEGEPYGDVFLVLDDIGRLQGDLESVEGDLGEVLATGLNYGVHVIVAASRWADIRPKLRDHIGNRLELRLNDPADSELGRSVALTIPEGVPGRGLTREALAFQAALPPSGPELAAAARQRWSGTASAPPVRALPSLVRPEELAPALEGLPPAAVPIGLDDSRLAPVAIDLEGPDPHFLVLGDSGCGKTSLLRAWISTLIARRTPAEVQIAVLDYRRTLSQFVEDPHLFAYASTPPMVEAALARLLEALEPRLPASAELVTDALHGPRFWGGPHLYVFVDDYDWVAGPAGNPLAPLAAYLLQARDVGLHLVLARRVGGITRAGFEPVLQRVLEMGSPGLVMDGDQQEGPILGTQRAEHQPPGRGYLVRRNHKTVRVQTVLG